MQGTRSLRGGTIRAMRGSIAFAVLLMSGCALDRTGVPQAEPGFDAGPIELRDASADSGSIDGGRDAGMRDAGMRDAGMPDAGRDGGRDAGRRSSCDDLYGSAPGYVYCAETAISCEFSANTNGGDCNDLCLSLGGICLEAYDNADPVCMRRPEFGDDCFTDRGNEICICSR